MEKSPLNTTKTNTNNNWYSVRLVAILFIPNLKRISLNVFFHLSRVFLFSLNIMLALEKFLFVFRQQKPRNLDTTTDEIGERN